jgi:hypothetical protein
MNRTLLVVAALVSFAPLSIAQPVVVGVYRGTIELLPK